jgi:hypothetical protein
MKTIACLLALIVFSTVMFSGAAAQNVLLLKDDADDWDDDHDDWDDNHDDWDENHAYDWDDDDMDEWNSTWMNGTWMNADDIDPNLGEVTYEDEELRITDYTDENATYTVMRDEFSDFKLSVDTELTDGNTSTWQQIYTRLQNDSGYVFSINADGQYQIQKIENGTVESLVEPTESEYIDQGTDETNEVMIESIGDEMTLFIDEHEVSTVNDSSFSTGRIALGAESLSGTSATVAFEDFEITETS